MNGSAQSMPSPVSPYSHQAKSSFAQPQRPRQCYPSSPAMSPQQHQASGQGLGLYPSSMPQSHQSTVSPMMASPQSEAWSQSAPMGPEYTTSQPPDIFSAEFDPFSGFPAASTIGMVGQQSPEASGLEFSRTSPSSSLQSHRGSISSYASSEGSESAYTPRVKPEDPSEWCPSTANEHVLQRTQAPATFNTSYGATLPSQTEHLYRPQPSHTEDLYRPQANGEWSKGDTAGYVSELHGAPDGRLPRFDMSTVLPSVTRIKKKRQRTTPEEATHECRVCGKLFKRSYNWKSHLETHNPERKYPHPCTAIIGDAQCTKKFQRKTDLDRHYDSVHLKARNHKCTLCGNRFARRDTLRRHTEDGCPKRFELGIRESTTAAAIAASQQPPRWSNFPPRTRSYSVGMPQPSPMSMPPLSAASVGAFPMYPSQVSATVPSPAF